MSAPQSLEKLIGHWTGTSRLYRPWLDPPETESESSAIVDEVAMGKFVTIEYTWALDGQPQAGFMLLGCENNNEEVKATWVDSWHMSDKSMVCEGGIDVNEVINIRGSYPAPPGPDWGWRIVIEATSDNSFIIVMYNITPDGEEMVAVESRYVRQS
jgi:hypothetical protein